jgi:hypothetical protein
VRVRWGVHLKVTEHCTMVLVEEHFRQEKHGYALDDILDGPVQRILSIGCARSECSRREVEIDPESNEVGRVFGRKGGEFPDDGFADLEGPCVPENINHALDPHNGNIPIVEDRALHDRRLIHVAGYKEHLRKAAKVGKSAGLDQCHVVSCDFLGKMAG